MEVLIAILLLIVLVFGAASGMQSYASAKQAQATIEVAQVAQVNAWGNLVVIMLLALVILCVLALIVWMVLKNSTKAQRVQMNQMRTSHQTPDELPNGPRISVETLVQLKVLEMLERMSAPPARPQLETKNEPMDMEWLRRQ